MMPWLVSVIDQELWAQVLVSALCVVAFVVFPVLSLSRALRLPFGVVAAMGMGGIKNGLVAKRGGDPCQRPGRS